MCKPGYTEDDIASMSKNVDKISSTSVITFRACLTGPMIFSLVPVGRLLVKPIHSGLPAV